MHYNLNGKNCGMVKSSQEEISNKDELIATRKKNEEVIRLQNKLLAANADIIELEMQLLAANARNNAEPFSCIKNLFNRSNIKNDKKNN